MVMNLIWAILNVHHGTAAALRTLLYFFSVMEKVHLGTERLDYYTLLAALTQILDRHMMNTWRMKCEEVVDGKFSTTGGSTRRFVSLQEFISAEPSAATLLAMANQIQVKYVTAQHIPEKTVPVSEQPTAQGKAGELAPADSAIPPAKKASLKKKQADEMNAADNVSANIHLLTWDLLYVVELVSAISAGNFGCVEDILPDIACLFRGAGSNNYLLEMLHWIFNLKEVWTPEFA